MLSLFASIFDTMWSLKMSFFKSLGEGLGSLSGEILGGAIKKVGEVTDSRFI